LISRAWRVAPALAGLLLAAGCGGSSAPASGHGPKVTVLTGHIDGVGQVLVTAKGYALYMFEPDNQRSVTCTGACAGSWPPVKVPDDAPSRSRAAAWPWAPPPPAPRGPPAATRLWTASRPTTT
jgi:predicted lipoprotein with Yx(FWY)xxD motif